MLFKKLNAINSNEIRCLKIYGNFLHDIVNEELEVNIIIN